MTRAQERLAVLPVSPRIPPVVSPKPPALGHLPLVVIPSPGIPKIRRFCAFWGGNPAAVWTGARSGLGTPVECRGFRHSGTAESAGLQIPEDLLFLALKPKISDLWARPSANRTSAYAQKASGTEARRTMLLHRNKNNRPGMILLHKTRIATHHPARITGRWRRKSFKTSSVRKYTILKVAGAKSFRMIFLCKLKNNCPGMILLQKKGGEGYWG
jgi:hypothetical protein